MYRALFIGDRLEALQALSRCPWVVAVATRPGSRVALRFDFPVSPTDCFTDRARAFSFIAEKVAELEVDLVLSAGFPWILPEWLLATGPRFLNSHPSLLPERPGYSAIKEAFTAGDQTTGVTVHEMAPEVDAGRILQREEVLVIRLSLPQIYSLLFSVVEPLAIHRALTRET